MTHPDAVDAWDHEPTPELTAEEQLTLKELWDDFDEYYGCGGGGGPCGTLDIHPASAGETPARRLPTPKLRIIALTRRQAFEEAAEVQPKPLRRPGAWASLDYKAGWDAGMTAKANAIRALAKEQGDSPAK